MKELRITRLAFPALALVMALAPMASMTRAQSSKQYVAPAKGQSPQQQSKDEAACHDWAVLQVGFDPTKVAKPQPQAVQAAPVQQTPSKSKSTTRGVLRGAAVGAGIGSLAGGSWEQAAVAGAVVGGVKGNRTADKQQEAAQQQAAAQTQAAVDASQQAHDAAMADWNARNNDYRRARAACLESKGYTVK